MTSLALKAATKGKRLKGKVESELARLSLSQKLYLFAFVALLIAMFSEEGHGERWVFVSATLGLAAVFNDVWPMFVKLWDTLLGKGIILIFNAGVAHIALGFAGQQINDVVGVEPQQLSNALFVTTLIMAPMWILVFTMLAMMVYLFVLNCLLAILALLRLLRIRIAHFEKREAYPLTTMLVRIIVVPAMIYALVNMSIAYGINISVGENGTDFEAPEYGLNWHQGGGSQTAVKLDVGEDSAQQAATVEEQTTSSDQELSETAKPAKQPVVSLIVAWLTYQLETYPKSYCAQSEGERVRFIGLNEILVAKRADEFPIGYEFSVRICEFAPDAATVVAP
ncbi:hypothetical protein [Paraferrimonas sedimenticola]|uniref:Uncharacterized protein n=1 Tax=Paraferrimonas sedimenticola TaxID=375674 RepID=A0AA37RYS0_9GAMM|nr:hypothetical protein [Paraferrimonas sedimenticola]GLP97688.1 hypothetical protein GCM10007895_29950 [Paraferrimonas sedimenticola]